MKLKEFIDDTGITIAKLAKRANVSFSTIKNAIEGKNLTLENAYKIHLATKGKCTLLDMLPEELLQSENRLDVGHVQAVMDS